MRNRKEFISEYKVVAISAIALFLTICVLIFLAGTQDAMNLKTAKFGLRQNTNGQAHSINTSIAYAYSSIQVSAVTVSRQLREADADEMMCVLDELRDNTPFSEFMYINDDGIVVSSGDKYYVGREDYFKRAMNGEKGVIVDINPQFSDEPVMMFYAPLLERDDVVGVLVGILRGSTSIRPMFTDNFNGQKLYGFIIDENNGIVTSNSSFDKNIYLNEETLDVIDSEKEYFLSKVEEASGDTFIFACPEGDGIACVSYIGDTNLRIVQVYPAECLNKSLFAAKIYTYIAFGLIMIISVVVFVLIYNTSKKTLQKDISNIKMERDKQLSLLLSMADMYYSMHFIDLRDFTYIEYTAHNQVKELGKKYSNVKTLMYEVMHATMTPEYLSYALEFTDLETLPDRMKNKKTTYTDLLGKNIGWIRFSFITIEADEKGLPIKVMATTQAIDEEKKREQSLIYKTITDELTGISNRRAYEDDIAEYADKTLEDSFVFVSMDVNELKIANDTYGHAVGDELLRGAVACMRQCFGSYGKLYRVGGDEFAAIIFASEIQLQTIKKDFDNTIAEWKNDSIQNLSISSGYVTRQEAGDMKIQDIVKLADQRMYAAKSAYYRNKGIDRRGQSV